MEKAGILREDIPLVTGVIADNALEVIGEARCGHRSAWLQYGRDFGPWTGELPLAGEHQRVNAAVAVATARLLAGRFGIGEDALIRGVAGVRWPARFERLGSSPEIIVDGAHNPQAANTSLRNSSVLGDCSRLRVMSSFSVRWPTKTGARCFRCLLRGSTRSYSRR